MAVIGKKTSGSLLLKTSTGKIGTCPTVEYSPYNCCCYLDPSPSAWSSATTYQKNAAVSHTPPAWEAKAYPANSGVSHNSKIWHTTGARTSTQVPGVHSGWVEKQGTWYSTINGDNLNWEPGASGNYWMPYTHCSNEDWNQFSQFGGIAKTPMFYVFSIHGITTSRCENCGCVPDLEKYAKLPLDDPVVITDVLIAIGTYPCQWVGYIQCIDYPTVFWQISIKFDNGKTVIRIVDELYSSCDPSGIIFSAEIDGCLMAGTVENQIEESCKRFYFTGGSAIANGYGGVVSFRPLDCNYEKWDSTKTYAYNACVAWNGKFYRSCDDDNLNHEPEDDASNVCETGYYWRLV